MEKKINKLEQSKVEIIVSVEKEKWSKAQKDAFDKLAANVEIKGFRKGKAPAEMVKAKVDQGQVFDRAINALLQDTYRQVITEENLRPFARPVVDVTKLSNLELELKFTLVLAPEVTLGEYKGLHAEKKEVVVTDHEIEHALEHLVKDNASLVVKEDAAKLGDTVVMDFEGFVDGKAFEGGKAENYALELGSGQFIPGFEDQLVGAKAGEDKEVNVTFPAEYVPELASKDAMFKVKVHEVKEKKVPELTDELVAELKINNVSTVEQFKEYKKNELMVNKKAEEKRTYINKLIDAIAKDSKIDIPEEIIDTQVASRREDLENKIKQSGLNLEQYLQFVGQKEEEFLAKLHEEAAHDVANYMVMEEIAVVEKIEITQEEVDFEYAKIADQYKMKIEDVKKALAQQENEFRNNLKMQRVEEFLISHNE